MLSVTPPLREHLSREARALGFDCVGVTDPDSIAQAAKHFRDFLDAGAHGDMDWLADRPERRADPRVLWPDVRSVIMLGVNYGPDQNPLAILEQRTRGAISVYAQGDDYHDLIKKRLKALARWLVAVGAEVRRRGQGVRRYRRGDGKAAGAGGGTGLAGQAHQPRVARIRLVAVSRRDLHDAGAAARRSRRRSLRLLPGLPRYLPDRRRFPAPYKLDARRCISYLTIENKGPIPHEFRKAIGNRIYGCDDCLAVCPWNKFAQAGREAKLAARDELRAPGARRTGAARRCRVPRAVHQIAGQAHRPRPLRAQCADRDRQLGGCRAGGRGRTPARRRQPAGARRRGVGAVATDGAGGV